MIVILMSVPAKLKREKSSGIREAISAPKNWALKKSEKRVGAKEAIK